LPKESNTSSSVGRKTKEKGEIYMCLPWVSASNSKFVVTGRVRAYLRYTELWSRKGGRKGTTGNIRFLKTTEEACGEGRRRALERMFGTDQ
jgi:hypothetical protein